jgi:predicted 3-demethylubiquinone-9 3-methyltransferase (glyoxalase superfamily)
VRVKSSKLKPFLWFDDQAEEAAKFYTSIFRDSRIGRVARFPEGSPRPAGMVMTAEFQIEGQDFVALNGGPEFKFTEAVSFSIACDSQEEVDYYWDRLVAGGTPVQCGWLKDRFGLSWQVTPTLLDELLTDKDAAKAQRVMEAMLKMVKIDLPTLQKAAEGK